MTLIHSLALVAFVLVFALSMWRKTNMGAIALAGAFVAGTLLFGKTPKDLLAGWPTSLMLTLVGVTFLFGIARENGTIDKVVRSTIDAVGGRLFWIPWVFFALAAFITAAGAVTPATNAILVPIGLSLAYKHKINPLLVGISILNGTNAGGFSPIAVYYTIVAGALKKAGLVLEPGPVFAATFIFNVLLNVLAMFIFGGFKLRGQKALSDEPATVSRERLSGVQWVTLATLAGLIVAVLFFGVDIGFAAMTAAVVLALIWPQAGLDGAKHIAWSVVLLIGGVITYVSLLESVGLIKASSTAIAGLSVPLLVALGLLVVSGLTSAFASTIAMFGIMIPLAAPLMGSGSLPLLGFAIALCISASAVDSSPLSTGGALVVANSDEADQQRVFNRLMQWGLAMVAVAPLTTWLVFVVL